MGRRGGGAAMRGVKSSSGTTQQQPWACSSLSSSDKFLSLYEKTLEDWEARNFESLVCTSCLLPEQQPAVPVDKPGSISSIGNNQIVVFPHIISRGSVVGKKVYCSTSVNTTMTDRQHKKKGFQQGGIHSCSTMFPNSARHRSSEQPPGTYAAHKGSQQEQDNSLHGRQCRGLFLSLVGAAGMRLLYPPLQLPLLEILLFSQNRALLSHKGGLWRLPFNLALAILRPFCGTLVRRCLTALLFIVQMKGKPKNITSQSASLSYTTPDPYLIFIENTHLDHIREFTICSSPIPIACPDSEERAGGKNASLCSDVRSFFVEECGGKPNQITACVMGVSEFSPIDLGLLHGKHCSHKRSLQQQSSEEFHRILPQKRFQSTEHDDGLEETCKKSSFLLEPLPTSLGKDVEQDLREDLVEDMGEDLREDEEGLGCNPPGIPTNLAEGRPSGRAVERENDAWPTKKQRLIIGSLERVLQGGGQAEVCVCAAQAGLEREEHKGLGDDSLGEVSEVEKQGENNRLSSSRGMQGASMVSQHENSSPESVWGPGTGEENSFLDESGCLSSSRPCPEGISSEALTENFTTSRLHIATQEAVESSHAAPESDSLAIAVVLGEEPNCDSKGQNGIIHRQCLEICDGNKLLLIQSESAFEASTAKDSMATFTTGGKVDEVKQEDNFCISQACPAGCSPGTMPNVCSSESPATAVPEIESHPDHEFADHPTCIDLRQRRHSHGDQTYLDMQDLLPPPWGQLIFWHGRCKEGRPTLWVMLGKAVRQLPSHELKHFIAVTVSHIEYAELNFFKGPVKQMNIVMDLEGLGFMRLPPMNILSSIGAVLNRDYAGRGGWIILVNAPVMLGFVISAIQGVILRPSYNKGAVIDSSFRGFLEGKERIMMMGSKYRPVLQKHFEASMLPLALGGHCPCTSDEALPCKFGSEFLRLPWKSSSSI